MTNMIEVEERIAECETTEDLSDLFIELADDAMQVNRQSAFVQEYINEHFGAKAYDDILEEAFSTIDREDAFENGVEPPYPEIATPNVDMQTNEILSRFFGLEV